MRIAFDGTTLQPGQTGIGYYTEHLLRHLLQEAQDEELVVISNRPPEPSQPLPSGLQILQGRGLPIRNLWIQLMAPGALRRARADLAHFTNSVAPLRRRIPTVVTIHDMSLALFPRFHPLRRKLTRPLVKHSARRADAVITVSQSARQDIQRLTGIAAEKVHVIPEAAAPAFQPLRDHRLLESARQRYGLGERVILFVGTIEPRKNLLRLLRAFAPLRRSHQLVCVGEYGWGYKEVCREIDTMGLQSGREVLLTGYVPFGDLPALYNLAEIFVFPSLHEGFGLPVLEAMACGIPVITSRNSSLSEVAGEAAELVDPLQARSIRQALQRLAADPDRRRQLSRCGLRRSQLFSWQETARQTLRLYHQIADR